MAALTEVAWSRWLLAALPVAAVHEVIAGTRRAAHAQPVLASAHNLPFSPLDLLGAMENTITVITISTNAGSNAGY